MTAALGPHRLEGAMSALMAAGATFLPPLVAACGVLLIAQHLATPQGDLMDLAQKGLPGAITAGCAALASAALMLRQRHAQVALVFSIAVLVIATADLVMAVSMAHQGAHESTLSTTASLSAPVTVSEGAALWMSAVAIILLVRWPSRPLTAAFALAAGSMGIGLMMAGVWLHTDLSGQTGLTHKPDTISVALIIALCVAILAAAAAVKSTPAPTRIDHYLAWSTLGLVTLVWIGWQQMEHGEWRQRLFETALMRDSAVSELSIHLSERATSQQRLANRWSTYGSPTEEQWVTDANEVLVDFPGVFAIAYVDVDRVVRWRTARDGNNEGTIGRNLNADDQRRAAFDAATASKTTRATASVKLLSGAHGFVFITPIFSDGALQGFVVSSITSDDLVGLLSASAAEDFHISIQDSGGQVSGDAPQPSDAAYGLRTQGTLNVMGQVWTIDVWPTAGYLLQRHSRLPAAILGIGLFCVLLVGAALAQTRSKLLHRTQAEELMGRLARTLATINEGFVTLSPDWNVTYLNQRAMDILEWPSDAARGYRLSDLSVGFEGSEAEALLRRVVARQEAERKVLLRPNRRQWLEIAAHPVPEGVAMYLRDVTAERARDAQLRLLETAVSRQNDALIITDLAGPDSGPNILYVNEGFTRMTGYTRDEVIGRTPRFLQGPATNRTDLDRVRAALLKREPIRVELVNYTKDGREYHVEMEIASFADEAGQLTHHVAVERDITQRKRAEEASAIMEERLQQVMIATNDVIWDIDLGTRSVWYNDNGRRLFFSDGTSGGCTMDDWEALIHPDDRDRVHLKMWQALDGKAVSLADDYRLAKHDGNYAQVVSRARIIRDTDGRPVRMVGALIDETDRRDLEHRLRTAQRLEAVGQLTGGIAHDFNNLLTVILGNAELLSERLHDQPVLRQMAESTMRAATSGSELTARLLTFARRQQLVVRDVDVNALVMNLTSMLGRTLPERIHIKLAPEDNIWPIRADASQIENAILNLAVNARDAMAQGGTIMIGTSNLTLTKQEAALNVDAMPGDYVEISVTDTGTGMSPEVLSRALEPFFTTKEVGKGTGLGLSMVYGFVRQSGGFLRISSQPDSGTRVGLCLPRAKENTAKQAEKPRENARITKGDEHVLVTEDDALVRENVANMLERLGYHVTLASSGAEALACLKADRTVDLLFTDVVMPGEMGGRELAEAALSMRPGLRVLFTSGYSDTILGPDGEILPGIPLLAKPYHLHDLASALRRSLDAG